MKKIQILLCAVLCTTLLLCGCGKKASAPRRAENTAAEASASVEPTAGQQTESENDDVIATVNGEQILRSDIGYYIYNNAVIELGKAQGGSTDAVSGISAFDWDAEKSSGVTYKESVMTAAVDDAINDLVFRMTAESKGYDVITAENESSKTIDSAIEASGEEKILSNIRLLGISDIDEYKKVYTNISIFEGVAKEFSENPNKYIDDIDVLSEFTGTKGASVQSILIPGDTENADVTAESAADRAKSGEDFARLMKEYNKDSGETEAGYTFPEGEVEADFEKAAFALKIGEVSDVVTADGGYYIIKRIAGAYELQNYWRSLSDVTISENAYDTAAFDEVVRGIAAALE